MGTDPVSAQPTPPPETPQSDADSVPFFGIDPVDYVGAPFE